MRQRPGKGENGKWRIRKWTLQTPPKREKNSTSPPPSGPPSPAKWSDRGHVPHREPCGNRCSFTTALSGGNCMMPCDTRRSDMPCGDVNNGHVVDTREPRLVTFERNKTIPTSSFTCPKELEKQVGKGKKSSPSRLPASFPVLVSSDPPRPRRPATKIPLLSLLSSPSGSMPPTTGEEPHSTSASPHLSLLRLSARRREASHPQPTTLLAFSLGASQPLTPQQSPRRGALWSGLDGGRSMMTATRRRWNQCLP